MRQANWKNATQILLLSFVIAGCSSSPIDPEGSPYTPATDIYTKPIDAARMVSYTENDVTYHFVDNQILVFLEDIPMNEDLVVSIAATVDGTVVGRISYIGMIQLETAPMNVDEMATVIEALEGIAGVTGAFPNLMSPLDVGDTCRHSGDLSLNLPTDPTAPERCAFEFPDFFNLLPVMRKFRSMGWLSPVKIAVIDTQFQGLREQFRQANITRLDSATGSYDDGEYPHGFWVTGILAADDDGQSLAGILPSALGAEGFELFIGDLKSVKIGEKWNIESARKIEMLVRAARDAKVDVVNVSSGTNCSINSIFDCMNYIQSEVSIIRKFSNTLFVYSAGNGNKEINVLNRAPVSGNGLSNLLVVAGTISCDPMTKHEKSNYGEGAVDVSAPYQVPILLASEPSQGWMYDSGGTSYSAPMVAGLAAILKSVHSVMTPAEIREYVITHGGPTDLGLGVYINYTRPVIALAREVHRNNPDIESLLYRDLDPLESVDPMAHVINRICGTFNLNVETIGSFLLDAGRTEQVAATVSGTSGLNLMLIKDDADPPAGQMSFFLNLAEPFELFYEYPLLEGTVQFSHAPSEQNMISGSNSQGSIIFKSCMITQRDQSYRPLSIEVEGEMTGTLELSEMFSPPWPAFFDSSFIMTAMIQGISESDPLWQVLESQCVGSIDP